MVPESHFMCEKVNHYRSEELIIPNKVIPQGDVKRNKLDVMLHRFRVTLTKTWFGIFSLYKMCTCFFLTKAMSGWPSGLRRQTQD